MRSIRPSRSTMKTMRKKRPFKGRGGCRGRLDGGLGRKAEPVGMDLHFVQLLCCSGDAGEYWKRYTDKIS